VRTITPAAPSFRSPAVHPHARGDDLGKLRMCDVDHGSPHAVGTMLTNWAATVAQHGSPPSTWGRSRHVAAARLRVRFTPTPVGTMLQIPRAHAAPPVHPHARGDDKRLGFAIDPPYGSPPRRWGRCSCCHRQCLPCRFTPAPVGTIWGSRANNPSAEVHPHAPGDDDSDPRRLTPESRFTPTPVGTIISARRSPSRTAVHPHTRGDDGSVRHAKPANVRFTPRLWGRLEVQRAG
jgi:hypothetical protein